MLAFDEVSRTFEVTEGLRAQTESIDNANYQDKDTSNNHLDSIVFHKLATYDILIGEVVDPAC